MADSKIDRRKNAAPYVPGKKPSANSEYFGKSYGQLKRESNKAAKHDALKKKTGGMDKDKRWGNSAMKGHGVNSPAMMAARKAFKDKK